MEDSLTKPRVTPTLTSEAKLDVPKADPGAKSSESLKESDLYATYELDHSKPYLAEYFGINELWNNPDLSYKDELNHIDTYLKGEISDKTLANTTEAVKQRVTKLEKLAGIDQSASPALRVQQLAAFAKYMRQLSDIKMKVKFDG